ncbi:aromatic ring-hydroxylating dioxygenase subunit alpha [Mycolicibacterium fortuitum]
MTITSVASARSVSNPEKERTSVTATSGVTPFIYQAWYVIAASDDVGHELSSITVLNQPLVFFRAEDGTPVVLDDRCAHRRFSLSKSHLKDDTIQCAYHGFTYDKSGSCIFAPGVTGELNFGVRKYQAVESGVWVWVWMGEGEGDPADIPMPPVDLVPYEFHGYTLNPCDYVLVLENLLDVTHLYYLHGPTVGTEVYANTPPVVTKSDDPRKVGFTKEIPENSFLLPALICGGDPQQVVRQVEEVWCSGPSIDCASIQYYLPDGSHATPHREVVVHAVTPETETTTHQFWNVRHDAPLGHPAEELIAITHQVFGQDVEVLAIQSQNIAGDTRPGVVENSIPSDLMGLRLRRMLQRLAAAERM